MCTLDGLISISPVNFSKSLRRVDTLKLVRSVNFNKVICPVNYDKPEYPVSSGRLVRPVNSSNFVFPVDNQNVDSNKHFHTVNSSNVWPADVRKPLPSLNSNKIYALLVLINL